MDSSSLQANLQMALLQFLPFMIAVVFHEFGHGIVAHFWGDDTAKEQGRMTLNPVPHVDVLGTVVFPLVMMISGANVLFGWAKPVPINPNRFRKYRPGLFWVSLAGPLTNFILAILSSFIFVAILAWIPQDFYLFEPLAGMAKLSIGLNWGLGIFNLLPLPPLDGSKIIESFLSYNATRAYERLTQYSFFILLALMFTGVIQILAYPIHFFTQLTLGLAASVFSMGGLL